MVYKTKKEAFEFLKGKKTMFQSKEQEKRIQEFLLKVGFELPEFDYTEGDFLLIQENGILHYGGSPYMFKENKLEFIYPFEILDIKIKELESEFKFKQLVLVRNSTKEEWLPALFCDKTSGDYPFRGYDGSKWKYCISYEGNESLLGNV